MEGFGGVLVLSLVMLAGSYLAGSIPLHLSMSEEKLQVWQPYLFFDFVFYTGHHLTPT